MSSNLKIKRMCAWCGKEFIAQKTTTACCSKQCANALYKKRKRDEAIKANWKSHATLTLLAKQDCPLWLQYD